MDMSLRDEVAAIEAMVKCVVNWGRVCVDEIWWLKRRSAASAKSDLPKHTKWTSYPDILDIDPVKQTITGVIQLERFFKV